MGLKHWFMDGYGGDIFGEEGPARHVPNDWINKFMRDKLLAEWFTNARKANRLHPDFDADLNRIWWTKNVHKWIYVSMGVAFAGIIFNPNYTSRHSFYLRKFTPIFFGAIGYQWYIK